MFRLATTMLGFRRCDVVSRRPCLAAHRRCLSSRQSGTAAGCLFEPQGEGRVDRDHRRAQLSSRGRPRSGSPASSRSPAEQRRTAKAGAGCDHHGHDVTLRGPDDTPDRYGRQTAFVFLRRRETPVQATLLAQGDALVSADVADKDCAAALMAAEAEARQAKRGHLGRPVGHKKRGKSGRYFGRDRAFYGGRGQGLVGPASWGNDLSELRTELDTGLCCDYFKAHDAGVRSGRNCA